MKNLHTFNSFLNESEEGYSLLKSSPQKHKNMLSKSIETSMLITNGWEDGVTEGFKEDMEEIGISDIDISYSGFWSQGDGASFTSEQ
jgi:hypothetical protein